MTLLMDEKRSVLPLQLAKGGNLESCGGNKYLPSFLFCFATGEERERVLRQLVCDSPLAIARTSSIRTARLVKWKMLYETCSLFRHNGSFVESDTSCPTSRKIYCIIFTDVTEMSFESLYHLLVCSVPQN